MSSTVADVSTATQRALVDDLSDLHTALSDYLDLADGGNSDNPSELLERFGNFKRIYGQVDTLYGAQLAA